MVRRSQADPVDGVLLLDKPLGMSSNAALQTARRLMNACKAGHGGTLDPLASGLLPLAFGEATKFSADLLDADKDYRAQLTLGITTATGDAEGEPVTRNAVDVSRARFEEAIAGFVGRIDQVPPMYSALKHNGRPLYALARAGVEVERAPRPITVFRLDLVEWDPLQPRVEVACSKGTYVRVLVEDIGRALGCGAHLSALRRTRVGALCLDRAVTLAELEKEGLSARRERLAPADALLTGLPRIELDAAATQRFGHGQRVLWPHAECSRVRVYGAAGKLLGLGIWEGGWLAPGRLISNIEEAI